MSKKEFAEFEKMILEFLEKNKEENIPLINKNTGEEEYITIVDKPTIKKGEPKTDIYILAKKLDNAMNEYKISVKKNNADFLENKTNALRAKEILGDNWEEIISNATKKLKDKFQNKTLVYFDKEGRVDKGSITLGWKFEFVNKKNGRLSDKIDLTKDQIIDIYSGTNLPESKKDAFVDGKIIKNSGVANYIYIGNKEKIKNSQNIIDNIIPISEFIDETDNMDLYFACKALNYRSLNQKNGKNGTYDGNRPLAVFVKWKAEDDKLIGELVFDEPLKHKGNEVYEDLKKALDKLNASNTNDLTKDQVIIKKVNKRED